MRLVFSQQDFERFDTQGDPPEDLRCAITRRLVVRPVSNPAWPQHVFEHKPLNRWLGIHRSHPTDPLSRSPLRPEQVQYDARRGIAAKLFRRQLAAHHRWRAEAPELTPEAAQEARSLAAAYTVQRFRLERTASRNVSEFDALLARVKQAIVKTEAATDYARSELVARLLEPVLTSQQFSEIGNGLKAALLCRERLIAIREFMTAMPAALRATFRARDLNQDQSEHLQMLDEMSDTASGSSVSSAQSIWPIDVRQDPPALRQNPAFEMHGLAPLLQRRSSSSVGTAQSDGPQLGDLPTLFREPPTQNLADDDTEATIGLAGAGIGL